MKNISLGDSIVIRGVNIKNRTLNEVFFDEISFSGTCFIVNESDVYIINHSKKGYIISTKTFKSNNCSNYEYVISMLDMFDYSLRDQHFFYYDFNITKVVLTEKNYNTKTYKIIMNYE